MQASSPGGGLAAAFLAALIGTAGAAAGAAAPPGGPAPKALVGRYRATFTVDEFRHAPLAKFLPNEDTAEELVILNALPGSQRGIGLHDLGGGSPTIPFGVTGSRIYLSCIGENERPTRAVAIYRWILRGKLLTLVKIKDPCRGTNGANQAYILTKHVWHKVANR